ncbi:helix-turn-helix domain-containing protein [Saccharopolyspora indica]|uniref:helix-turn-helix domain-containing protein n=1 Tax=Saccharopolyspora indica TaxID=1229659 RepID=UPI0022EA8E43|nr:helix-turn-helix transcriptional regulator [Saccharopolyspora indica]MDA3647494.1 helix-turn-helix transcriptional regulator [Saccharopolyspora indica]
MSTDPGHHDDLRPSGIGSAAEFMHGLRRMRSASGLTYRQLEARARARGDVLPYSTVATALRRDSLPRRELTAMFVRACGTAPEEAAEWLACYDRLSAAPTAVAPAPEPAAEPETPEPAAIPPVTRLGKFHPVTAVAALVACVGFAVFLLAGPDMVRPPNVSWFAIRTPHDTCLDFTTKDELGNPFVTEQPCKSNPRPDQRFALEEQEPGVFRIKVYNPETNGSTRCMDIGERSQLRPQACVESSMTQLFQLESAAGKWRIQDFRGECFALVSPQPGLPREVRHSSCADPTDDDVFHLVPA